MHLAAWRSMTVMRAKATKSYMWCGSYELQLHECRPGSRRALQQQQQGMFLVARRESPSLCRRRPTMLRSRVPARAPCNSTTLDSDRRTDRNHCRASNSRISATQITVCVSFKSFKNRFSNTMKMDEYTHTVYIYSITEMEQTASGRSNIKMKN
jgi:hypothetical protein